MAEQRGGYRRPSSPAPVSGPGAMSQRTDGQPARYMSGGPYGEGQEMMDLQSSAPMSEAPAPVVRPGRRAAAAPPRGEGMEVTPLFAPTQRPDEPLTAGASFGPGPGAPTSIARRKGRKSIAETLLKVAEQDESGEIDRLASLFIKMGI